MSRFGSRIAFLFAIVALVSASALGQASVDAEIPEKPAKYVTDRAGILGTERVDALSLKLEQFERETSNQILVWVDRKLPERFTLEDFTVRAAQKWKAGQGAATTGRSSSFSWTTGNCGSRWATVSRGDPRRHREADHRRRDRSPVPRGRLPGRHRGRRQRAHGGGERRVQGLGLHCRQAVPKAPQRFERLHHPRPLPLFLHRAPVSGATGIPQAPAHVRRERLVDREGGGGGRGRSSGGGGGGWSGGGGGGGGFSGGGGSFGGGGASGSW